MRSPVGSVKAGILGAADGVTSISGVIAGAGAGGGTHLRVAGTAIGGALAATISMAGAEMLSEGATDWAAIRYMGAGTALGAGLPAVPLLAVGGTLGWVLVAVVSAALAVIVGEAHYRMTRYGRIQAYALTAAILTAGAAAGWAAGRLL